MPRDFRHVKGMLRLSHTGIEKMPKDISGVYAFWCRDNGKCIYVGMAKDQPIRNRLRQHWRDSHNEKLKMWIREFWQPHRHLLYVC